MTDTGAAPARSRRTWLARMALAVFVCLLAFGWSWAARAGHPSDGTVVYTAAPGWSDGGVVVATVFGAGNPLRAGDVVTAIDGQPLTSGMPTADGYAMGDVVVYEVLRGGTRLQLPVTLTGYRFWDLVGRQAVILPYVAFMILMPSLVVARRPRDPAAWTLFGVTVPSLIGFASLWYGTQVIDIATGRLWVTAVAEVANCVVWVSMLHFAASFPRPWPLLRRRPWLASVGYATPFLAYGVELVMRLHEAEGLRRTWMLVAVSRPAALLFPGLILAAGVASYLLARDPAARQRMRLVTYAIGIMAGGYLLLGRLPDIILGHPLVSWDYFSLVVIPAQVLIAAAVLRYRLWDIQIMLRRSLVYGLVTIGLIIVYLLVAAGLGALLNTQLGLVPVLLAVVVALSFSLARSALRPLVSRLVFGAREDPYEVLRQLGRRLESAGSADMVLSELASTLVRTLRLAHAAVEVPGLDMASRGDGGPGPTATSIDLVHDGERIGRLVLDPGPDREPFGASDRRLLEGLAQHVSATAYRLLLAARLQRSLEGTVTMLEEERRRIRREIHDGLGPTIASAAMRLELGRALVRTDPDTADRILADLADVHRTLVGDIRQFVDGLRPTILDHLGLEAALRERVASLDAAVRVELDCAIGAGPLPAAVEVAAYRIVSEALTNVVRHAEASCCEVRVWRDGDLHLEVRDNGVGLPHGYRPGMGLTSIRERCAELGGAGRIGANQPSGTVVRCRLPLLAAGSAGRESALRPAAGPLSWSRHAAAPAPSPRSDVPGVPAS